MHVTASTSHAPPPTVAVASDPSGLTFEEWTPPDGRDSFTINATELRGVNFTMTEADELPPLQSELLERFGRGVVLRVLHRKRFFNGLMCLRVAQGPEFVLDVRNLLGWG